jgi:hypothetical protein
MKHQAINVYYFRRVTQTRKHIEAMGAEMGEKTSMEKSISTQFWYIQTEE